jgi:hypothetical protein
MNQYLKNKKVLLVTSNLDLTFQIVLILNKMGIKPYVLGPKKRNILYINNLFCKKYIEYDIDEMGYDYSYSISSFSNKFIGLLNNTYIQNDIDILIPIDYAVMITLSKYEKTVNKNIKSTAFLEEKTLRYLNDKWNFSKLCTGQNIPQPQTEVLVKDDEIEKLEIQFPIIVKPLNNGGGFGVKVLDSKSSLKSHIIENKIDLKNNPLLCQKYLEGRDLQVFILAIKGEIKTYSMCFMDKRGKREFLQRTEGLVF